MRRSGPTARSPLHEHLFGRIKDDEKLDFVYERIEMPVLPVLWRMERNGVLLDRRGSRPRATSLERRSAGRAEAYSGCGPAFQPGLA